MLAQAHGRAVDVLRSDTARRDREARQARAAAEAGYDLEHEVWDLALAQWFPDWYGNGALSFFGPLFSGPPAFPPAGSNFGFYNNPKVNQMIQQASTAKTIGEAGTIWAQADAQVMADAAIFPIT